MSAPRFCANCGNPLNHKQKAACSRVCQVAVLLARPYPISPRDWHTTAICLRETHSIREIAAICNIHRKSISTLFRKLKLGAKKPVRKKKIPQSDDSPPIRSRKRVVPSVPTEDRGTKSRKQIPIGIPLREVYRWGFDLDLPLRSRGDVTAVSRAMRRIDPRHPGFVVINAKSMMVAA